MQGLTDEQLNDRGRDQARAARERIGEINFDAVCGFGLSILLLIIREQIHLAPGCAFGIRIGLYFQNRTPVLIRQVSRSVSGFLFCCIITNEKWLDKSGFAGI